jgi:hypothetical protein
VSVVRNFKHIGTWTTVGGKIMVSVGSRWSWVHLEMTPQEARNLVEGILDEMSKADQADEEAPPSG